ncbi:SEC-C metal-binding domain-containing protein [Neobacillus fumarioli]|uniref:SEC-C metal-binding domain-containing protein n=1 Tax=Neobacillus fumarioli TaxID=105229 RepID=UPI00082A3BF2|nr:SEC-C metal-binding domain-containing protein [Neobacillus fumarioli]
MNHSSIDTDSYEKVLEALEAVKETTRRIQQKKELKMWSDLSIPLTMKNALNRLSKDELNPIRKRLEIKGASHLKKGELIDLLSSKIPLLLEKIVMNMDLERYSFIQKIIRNGGFIEDPKLAEPKLDYFRECCMIFTGTYEGKRILAMPEEILKNPYFQENDKQLTAICRRNTEWIKLTQGLLYYYGTLTITEITDLLKKYVNKPIDMSEFLTVIDQARTYYEQIHMDDIGFSHIRVFDPEQVKREHLMRDDVDFFPFSKEQLLKAGEPDYIERNNSFLELVRYLMQHYEITKQEADRMAEECVYAINIGEPLKNILDFLGTRLEFPSFDSVQACMVKVTNLMNHTRQWFLKGYSSQELFAREQKAFLKLPDRKEIEQFSIKKKIGRNDPCPCGSGKKYKKCCGR